LHIFVNQNKLHGGCRYESKETFKHIPHAVNPYTRFIGLPKYGGGVFRA
jgi:hypothetical protein